MVQTSMKHEQYNDRFSFDGNFVHHIGRYNIKLSSKNGDTIFT